MSLVAHLLGPVPGHPLVWVVLAVVSLASLWGLGLRSGHGRRRGPP
jgi:hypothetical protein